MIIKDTSSYASHSSDSDSVHASIFDRLMGTINRILLQPFIEFTTREYWLAIILFALFYKFTDAFLGVMTNPFLLEAGYTKLEIAAVVKFFGLFTTIVGSVIGPLCVRKFGTSRMLMFGLAIQMLSNLGFLFLHYFEHSNLLLAVVMSIENFCSGFSGAVFVTYACILCNHTQYTATQYATISAIISAGRSILSAPSGFVVDHYGWVIFIVLSSVLSAPCIFILKKYRQAFSLKIAK